MKTIRFNRLFIINHKSKKYFDWNLEDNNYKKENKIYIITGEKGNSDNIGKTSILKSFYYTLGGNISFPNGFPPASNLIFILFLTFDEKKYIAVRKGIFFSFYDYFEKKIIFESKCGSDDLIEKLSNFFGFSLEIQSNKLMKKSMLPLDYYYSMNFMDQSSSKPFKFSSFLYNNEKMNLSNTQIFYLVLWEHFLSLRKYLDEYLSLLEILNYKNVLRKKYNILKNLDNTLSFLKQNNPELESIMSNFDEISSKLSLKYLELEKIETEMDKYFQDMAIIEREINILKKDFSKVNDNELQIWTLEKCPLCGNLLKKLGYLKMLNFKINSTFNSLQLNEQIHFLEKKNIDNQNKFNNLKDKYDIVYSNLKMFIEDKINEIQDNSYNTSNEFLSKLIILFDSSKIKLQNSIKTFSKKEDSFKKLMKERKPEEIDKIFSGTFNRLAKKFDCNFTKLEKITDKKKIPNDISTQLCFLKNIWFYSLIYTKNEIYKYSSFPSFPIILDQPDNFNLEEKDQLNIYKLYCDLPDTQLIFSISNHKILDNLKQENKINDKNIKIIKNKDEPFITNDDLYDSFLEEYDWIKLIRK